MYSRADLSRTVTLVVAPSLTADSTGVFARASDATDATRAGAIDLDRSNGATIGSEIPVSSISGSVRFEAAMAKIHAQAQRDPAATRLIAPICKVE